MKLYINEMAKLIGLSKHTLRYYDKIGLINPKYDQNGYRYYNDDHIFELSIIRLLREMNVPIVQIKDRLSNPFKADEYNQLLQDNKQKIENQIRDLERTKDLLDKKINFYNHYKQYLNKPIVKKFPERLAIKVGEIDAEDRTIIEENTIKQITDNGQISLFNRALLHQQENIENLYITLTEEEKGKVKEENEILLIPAGEYISLLLEGTEDELKRNINEFLIEMKEKEGLENQFLIEYMNENYLLIGDETRYITEFQIFLN
ncbi:MerR family transcriptional regulator [Vallitalea okinawensis]|uniref:MerR family transcriptional regulator n=1 Tax=Vallitalea okinawensis TaxID=2078660 RepID=UPI000CFAA75E|nr:MerR family transcriptional regulator [Vallitalea okinawensis]